MENSFFENNYKVKNHVYGYKEFCLIKVNSLIHNKYRSSKTFKKIILKLGLTSKLLKNIKVIDIILNDLLYKKSCIQIKKKKLIRNKIINTPNKVKIRYKYKTNFP